MDKEREGFKKIFRTGCSMIFFRGIPPSHFFPRNISAGCHLPQQAPKIYPDIQNKTSSDARGLILRGFFICPNGISLPNQIINSNTDLDNFRYVVFFFGESLYLHRHHLPLRHVQHTPVSQHLVCLWVCPFLVLTSNQPPY